MKKLASIAISLAVMVSTMLFPIQASADGVTRKNLKMGTSYSQTITATDIMEYKFSVAGASTLNVNFNNKYAGWVIVLKCDAKGEAIVGSGVPSTSGLSVDNTKSKTTSFSFNIKDKGDYIIRLFTDAPKQDYTLTASLSGAKETKAPEKSDSKETKSKITITAEKTSVLEKASATSKQMVTAKKGHTFTVIGSTKTYWKVQFKKKNDSTVYTGYVLKKDSKNNQDSKESTKKDDLPPTFGDNAMGHGM